MICLTSQEHAGPAVRANGIGTSQAVVVEDIDSELEMRFVPGRDMEPYVFMGV
jgi:hypothetical protein